MSQVVRAFWFVTVVTALSVTACGATRDTEPTQPPHAASTHTTTPTASPTPASVTVHDSTTRVGIPQVDAIIDAVLRHDTAALTRLVELIEMPCTEERGNTGKPVCADGRTEGDPQPAFPSWSCEPQFVLSLQDAQQSVTVMLNRSPGLYSVWEPRTSPAPTPERAAWTVLFATDLGGGAGDTAAWWVWIDEDGAIIGQVQGGCAGLDEVMGSDDRVILPPPAQPTATSP